ncbi:MAG TPA: LamG-like jellyroll fold domain-containing protein [Tepidisphaeraceae bacterium]|nr:LamG-like jellyroll fold domain-containing protein [Tepidisphaeraceae bacterium]
MTLGVRSDNAFQSNGSIDEAAYYTNALSAAQILAHYQNGTNASPGTPYQNLIASDGAVGYWRLSEANPTYSTAANSGTLGAGANAKYINGVTNDASGPKAPAFPGFGASNPCGNFDGTSGSVGSPLGVLNNKSNFTVMGWIKRGAVHTIRGGYFGQNNLLEMGDANSGAAIEAWFEAPAHNIVQPYPWADDEWGFLAVTADGATENMYFNGVVSGQTFSSVTSYGTNEFKFNIGGGGIFNASGDFFMGNIDEVAAFDKVLSAGRILSLYLTATGSVDAPFMVADPPTQNPPGTVYTSTTFSLGADAAGALPLHFQWRQEGTNVPGATSETYTKANAAQSDAGNYDVVITNNYGSVTSQVVTVTVNPAIPVSINTPPQSRSVYVGGTANFFVLADGTAPFTYQWKKGGVDMTGQTNQTLTLPNVSAGDAATYTVGVTNVTGGVLSAGAVLSVVTPAPGSYAQAVMTNGPINYWRLGESSGSIAFDSYGGLDGLYTNGVALGVPSGLPFGGGDTAVNFDGTSGQIVLNPVAAVDNSIPAPWTAVFWARRTDPIQPSGALIDDRLAPVSASLRLEQWQNTGKLGISRYGGFGDFAYNYSAPSGVWVQLVFVGRTNGTDLYVNGLLTDTSVNSMPLPRRKIGASTSSDFLKGDLDEISLYNKALSASAIANLYAAGQYGTTTPPLVTVQPNSVTAAVGNNVTFNAAIGGSIPIALQWKKNGVSIPGATSQTLTLSNIFFTDAANYVLYGTNSLGFTNTAAATLTVLPQPSYANQTNGLVLHLRFDNNYLDTSGRANDASAPAGSPGFIAGKVGQGVNINTTPGANYLTVSDLNNDLQFDVTNSFTVSLWLQYSAAFNDDPIIGNSINSTYQFGWVLTEDGGRFEWTAVSGGSVIADPVSGTSPLINNGAWHHVAVAFDRNAGIAASYVDGARVATHSLSGLGSLITGQTLTIGQDPLGAYGTANFNLDDLGIWSRALTDYDVLSVYNAAQNSGVSFDTYGPFKVHVNAVGANLYISYQGGTLYEATSVTGSYTPVSGATAPVYITTPSATQKFYKVH